uniref:Ig-like domain-containing protein n=1 Tax=Gadus morhua TaxID=8049 RepID=A0A8C5FRQ2_GADMO
LYGPDVALDGHVVEFGCRVLRPPGEPLLLQLFRALAFYTSLDGSPAVFPMVVRRASHEGNLECVASVQNNSRIQPSVSPPHRLKVLVPVGGATLAIRSREEEFFEGERLVLSCNVTSGNYVSYSWLLDDQPPPGPTPQPGPLYRYKLGIGRHSQKTVWEHLWDLLPSELASRPDLSYAVEKQNQTFSARVTCLSSRGTPPITFSLLGGAVLLARQTSEQGPSASFSVPLVPDAPPRRLRCRAENGGRVADGTETAVHVGQSPVGGPVTLTYEYITAEDFSVTAVTFFCRVAKGSHPRFQWFLNGTLLGPDAPAFYTLLQPSARQSVLLLPVDRRSSGTYHCRVSDLYDNTTGVPSGKLYLDREDSFGCRGALQTCPLHPIECYSLTWSLPQWLTSSLTNPNVSTMVPPPHL